MKPPILERFSRTLHSFIKVHINDLFGDTVGGSVQYAPPDYLDALGRVTVNTRLVTTYDVMAELCFAKGGDFCECRCYLAWPFKDNFEGFWLADPFPGGYCALCGERVLW